MRGMHAENEREAGSAWRKLGMAGFLFFLIKGLLWLTAPAFFYYLS